MKRKSIFTLIFSLAVFLVLYGLSYSRVTSLRGDYVYRLHAAAMPLPPEVLNVLAGEFKGMVANYLLLEAASFVGSNEDATAEDWDAVARLIDQSNSLDPYFRQTYRLAQATLAWKPGKADKAIKILERSRKHLTWDWEPGFFVGFDYYYFLKDNRTASQKLMETSKIPGAPITLATLGSRLASKSGQTGAAIDFLVAIYEKTDDENTKELIIQRIRALKGVAAIQAAMEIFKKRFGRPPERLEELVDTAIIKELPQNPYDRPYKLRDGYVDF